MQRLIVSGNSKLAFMRRKEGFTYQASTEANLQAHSEESHKGD
jgi:hypothetical protein